MTLAATNASAVAAARRLNANRSFHPQQLLMPLNDALAANSGAREPRRAARVEDTDRPLAA